MNRFVFVFIEKETVRCYPNLKQLCDNNLKVSYFKAHRALLSNDLFKDEGYMVAKDEMRYKTHRRFKRGNDE